MSKVGEIIAAALREIRVIDPDQNPEPRQYQTAIEKLNRMMQEWEADNLALGWIPVSAPDDDFPADFVTENAVIFNLAVRLRTEYGASADPELIDAAKDSYTRLLRLAAVRSPIVQIVRLPAPSSEYDASLNILSG